MKKLVSIIILIIIVCVLSIGFFIIKQNEKLEKKLSKINLKNKDNLMIVAHPDDETIWGGAHLLEEEYLVVCITSGRNIIRTYELNSVMKESNNVSISLGYPDKKKGKRDNWDNYYNDISKDLEKIIKLKNWKKIVTHNPKGEYGHIHHIKTNQIVTDIYNKDNIDSELYFFGDYYTKKNIKNKPESTYKMSTKNLKIKTDKMIKKYKTQKFIKKRFNHIFKYEDWVKYEKEEVENEIF